MRRTLLLCMFALSACDDDQLPAPKVIDQSPSQMMDSGAEASTSSEDDAAQEAPPDARIVDLTDSGLGDIQDGGARDASADAARDGGADDTTGATARCPAYSKRSVVEVAAGQLPSNLFHWTCDNIYLLTGVVYVHTPNVNDAQILTIDPGTVVRGQRESLLVVTRNARIDAQGTVEDPIVFTSAQPVGARKREDWAGITLLGAAPRSNDAHAVEGIAGSAENPLLAYGPRALADAGVASDAGRPLGNDAHNCGALRYVRVEFASQTLSASKESNGIQLYSCGRDTVLDYVQVHKSGDDGVEVFGGSTDFRHLVLTGASDEGFDFDEGWRGRAQFVVIQQHPDEADLGIEAGSSDAFAPDARLFNFTMIGTNGAANGRVGMRLRGGTRAAIRNTILLGFTAGAVDISGDKAAANIFDGTLSVENSVIWKASAPRLFPGPGDDERATYTDSTGMQLNLEDEVELRRDGHQNQVVDPQLPDPFNVRMPKLVPKALPELIAQHAATPSERAGDEAHPFFDTRAKYIGAFAPGGDDWTAGWTSYPEN